MPRPELPVVSCLITTYNHERWIAEAIESALVQARDYPAEKLDIVLVDDGSTDRTPEVVAAYRDRIRAIRKPNGGVLTTVNRALDEARGELFCFLSGDDVWRPGKIRRQVQAMLERPDVVLLYGDAEIIDGDGAPIHPSYYGLHGLPHPEGDIRGALLEKNVVCAPTAMLRTTLRERFHPIGPPAVWEDWWMYVHAAQAGPAAYLDGADVAYRVQGSNMHAGLTGIEHLRFLCREMPFRRWLLTETDLEGCAPDEVVSALRAFEWHAATIVGAGLATRDELVPVGLGERDRSAAAQEAATVAHAAGDHVAAVKWLVRALAWNPGAPVRPALDSALAQARAAALLPPAEVRGAVVLVRADELRHDPTLLAMYTEAFGADDDVTLVIDAAGWTAEHVLAELVPIAERHGLGDGGPDAVVLTDGRTWPRERLIALLAEHAGAESLRACHATPGRLAA